MRASLRKDLIKNVFVVGDFTRNHFKCKILSGNIKQIYFCRRYVARRYAKRERAREYLGVPARRRPQIVSYLSDQFQGYLTYFRMSRALGIPGISCSALSNILYIYKKFSCSFRSHNFLARCARAIFLNPGIPSFIFVKTVLYRIINISI